MTFEKITTVVNKSEIESFFNMFSKKTENIDIKFWLKTTAKNHFLKNINSYQLLSDDDYDLYANDLTFKKAIEKNEKIVKVFIDKKSERRLEHIIHYFESLKDLNNLNKISYKEAFKQSVEWTKRLNKKTDKSKLNIITEEGLKILHKFDNGYTLVKLTTKENFDREGKLMNHCVAGYYDRYNKEQNFMILSMRDKDNKPLATIEAKMRFDTLRIEQIKGRANREVYDYETAKLFFNYLEEKKTKYILNDESSLGPKIYDQRKKANIPLLLWDENGIINGNLDLSHSRITLLPPNLKIKGNLILSNSLVVMLNKIKVEGNVYADNGSLNIISDEVTIKGFVKIKKESLFYYPEQIKINNI